MIDKLMILVGEPVGGGEDCNVVLSLRVLTEMYFCLGFFVQDCLTLADPPFQGLVRDLFVE